MATKKQERTRKLLEDFGKRVVKMARRNLTTNEPYSKIASGKLHKSLGFKLKFEKGEPVFDWVGMYYGKFVNEGRKPGSMPPPDKLVPWIARRGIQGRNKKTGRFITRKSLSWAIAINIKKYGIKPTNFFTNAFNSVYKNMPEKFTEAFGEDMLNIMETAFKTD